MIQTFTFRVPGLIEVVLILVPNAFCKTPPHTLDARQRHYEVCAPLCIFLAFLGKCANLQGICRNGGRGESTLNWVSNQFCTASCLLGWFSGPWCCNISSPKWDLLLPCHSLASNNGWFKWERNPFSVLPWHFFFFYCSVSPSILECLQVVSWGRGKVF